MDLHTLGRFVFVLGIGLAALGAVLMLLARVPILKHLGHLPGDIRIEGEHFSCFFPIVIMIIITLLLSLELNIAIRLINR